MCSITRANQKEIGTILQLLEKNNLPHQDFGPHVDFFLIMSEKKIAGVIGAEIYSPYALLRSLAVADSFKKKGMGTRLTVFLLDYLAVHGINEVFLLTTTADKFFNKMGFETIDRSDAPQQILKTKEFSEICPDSAVCMRYLIY